MKSTLNLDIFPASNSERAIRVVFFGDEIERVCEFDPLTGRVVRELKEASVFPATHYAVGSDKLYQTIDQIQKDCDKEVQAFLDNGKFTNPICQI